MKILKAMVFADDGSRPPLLCDAIEYDSRFWLVPAWLEMPDKAVTMPLRIIPLDLLRHQKVLGQEFDLLVNDGLPTQLFEREIPQELRSKFRVVESPDIKIPAGGGRIQ